MDTDITGNVPEELQTLIVNSKKDLHDEHDIIFTELTKIIAEASKQIILANQALISEVQKYLSLAIARNSVDDATYGELDILCEIYGSDKGGCLPLAMSSRPHLLYPHTYSGLYEKLFADIRSDVRYVFECGIGSNDPQIPHNMGEKYNPGASLRIWRDYFPNIEMVYGADVDRKILFSEDRIQTGYIDQTDKETVHAYFDAIDKNIEFNIMIDDGFHHPDAAKCLFSNSIHRLSQKGMYIIEDITVSNLKDIYLHIKKSGEYTIQIFHMTSSLSQDNTLLVIRKKQL